MMATAGKDTPEYKKLFEVQAELADVLGDLDGVALRLANKLLEMSVIGKSVRDAADIRGPHVTEIMRVNPIIKAMLSSIDLNPTMRYQEFRNALLAPAVGVHPDVVNKYLPAGTLILLTALLCMILVSCPDSPGVTPQGAFVWHAVRNKNR